MNIDFDIARRERLRREEPLTFTLGGETFQCRDAMAVIDMWREPPAAPESIVAGATTAPGLVLLGYAREIAGTLVPSERDRWWEMLQRDDLDLGVQGTDLVEVYKALVEEYAGRPTSPSADSSDGRLTDGSTSSSTHDAKASETSST